MAGEEQPARLDYVVQESDFEVSPLRVYLSHSHFSDNATLAEAESYETHENRYLVSLEVTRQSSIELTVFITLSTATDAPFHLAATYAVDYRMRGEVPETDREELWEEAVFYLAPRLLYPYIREHFTTTSARWKGKPLTLPFISIPLPPPEDFELPPPPPGSDFYQAALQLPARGAQGRDVAGTEKKKRKPRKPRKPPTQPKSG